MFRVHSVQKMTRLRVRDIAGDTDKRSTLRQLSRLFASRLALILDSAEQWDIFTGLIATCGVRLKQPDKQKLTNGILK
jgi:hypothetical protein